MKNFLLFVTLLATCFTACKKDTSPAKDPADNSKYPVRFGVTSFTQEIENLNDRKATPSSTAKTDSNHINYLVYKVYDATTQVLIKTIFQRRGTGSTFGQITDSLSTGKYIFAIAATQDSIMPFDSAATGFSGRKIQGVNMVDVGSEVYYRRMELTISGAVSQAIVLDRIVSKVTLVIKDQIPYNAYYIAYNATIAPDYWWQVPAYFNYLSGTLSSGGPNDHDDYTPQEYVIPDSLKGTNNLKIEFYYLNTGTRKINLFITGRDMSHTALAPSKDVPDILLEMNKNTIVKGALFGTVGSGSVVTADPNWKTDSIKVEF
ncbi:hypothetical protein ACTJJ0_30760 [Chitinophaga sp. 22321]|uniref:Fimbrillin-A associated anchor protein Mfa1 and Mfa2 n=1 Tax=Chitinophaga hostae TaxID=2831022 RepID=A0ABS5JAK6_9BACT|nr:hypothetical protein [Chitinophaga hostae]MBS0031622.1 hypothetical protein [Chitinophaga hostae]